MTDFDYFLVHEVNLDLGNNINEIKFMTWSLQYLYDKNGKEGLEKWLRPFFEKFSLYNPKLLYRIEDHPEFEKTINNHLPKKCTFKGEKIKQALFEIETRLSSLDYLTRVELDDPYIRFKLDKP